MKRLKKQGASQVLRDIGGACMALADYIGKFWTGAEAVYGVIIAMTFTSVLRGNPVVFEQMLSTTIYTALACCIAWGIADGMFYSWERGYIIKQENTIIRLSKSAEQSESAVSLVEDELDDTILRNVPQEARLDLYHKLVQYLSIVEERKKLSLRDVATIIFGTLLISTVAGLIVVVPFFLMDSKLPFFPTDDIETALKVSNLLGILLLFVVGYSRAFNKDLSSKIISGIDTSLIGIIITGITIVLGG
jgi:hypothetical protein